MKYDLTIFQTNEERSFLACFNSPRQRARGREEDQLLVFVGLNQPFENAQSLKAELENQAKEFYKTSGSVTKSMRVFIDGLNSWFLKQNNQFDDSTKWQTAILSLGVVHLDSLFIAQVGASQANLFSDGAVESFFDESVEARGLGLTTVVKPRYFQSELKDEQTLIFSKKIESHLGENDDLAMVVGELKLRADENEPLAVVRLNEGSGAIKTEDGFEFATLLPAFQLDSETSDADYLDEEGDDESFEESVPQDDLESVEDLPQPASLADDLFAQAGFQSSSVEPVQEVTQADLDDELTIAFETDPETDDENEDEDFENRPEDDAGNFEEYDDEVEEEGEETQAFEPLPKPDFGALKDKALQGVAAGAGWLRNVEQKAEEIAAAGKPSEFDDENSQKKELSTLHKVLIAVIVPLVVVFAAAMIFFTRGEQQEYAYYLAQAEASYNNAALMESRDLQREGWQQALLFLDKAASYEDTAEVKALRQRVQLALDDLDGARRLQYSIAFSTAQAPGMDIGAIASLNSDLFLLDRASGSVKAFRASSNGYQIDSDFKCEPGTYSGVKLGNLVDMISIPINNPAKAPILAIDGEGNLAACSIGQSPVAAHLPTPEGGWSDLKAIVFNSDRLYVLDSGNQSVWIYRGLTANFAVEPNSLFDQVKIDLSKAVDIEVDGEEIFLLHADGHTSRCTNPWFGGVNSCDDPYTYADTGTAGSNTDFENLKFSRFAYSQPPDPSIFYLEADRAELYQFSLRLNLNKVYRSGASSGSLPKSGATAFYVSADRKVFLAFGNQLYYASLP